MILTGRQIREGRSLTGIPQSNLAETAEIIPVLLIRADATNGMPTITKRDASALRSALEAAGVEFSSEDGGLGVRLRKAGAPE